MYRDNKSFSSEAVYQPSTTSKPQPTISYPSMPRRGHTPVNPATLIQIGILSEKDS